MSSAEICGLCVIVLLMSVMSEDWLAGLSIVVLWAAWRFLPRPEGPPVLALALTFQWLQVTSGIFYFAFIRRRLPEMETSAYRPMVAIGLGCIVTLMLGLLAGTRLRKHRGPSNSAQRSGINICVLLGGYLILTAGSGMIEILAFQIPSLTQAILAISLSRLVFLFLLFRRLSQPRLRFIPLSVLLAGELLLGFTGFFAGFREPLFLLLMVGLETFQPRRLKHWIALGGLAGLTLACGLLWRAIRTDYRSSFRTDAAFAGSWSARLDRVATLSSNLQFSNEDMLANVDNFVSRVWAVYYPALAVARIPHLIPHQGGAILWNAVQNTLMPRMLFPDKTPLISESEMVRYYSGVWVAGEESSTSIAFGYAAESYVDFGLPWMFVPVFVFGLFMGAAYIWFLNLIRNRELAVALTTVVFWVSLYLFERSWAMTLGYPLTLMFYLGGITYLSDHLFLYKKRPFLRPLDVPSVAPLGGRAGRVPARIPPRVSATNT